MPILGIMASAEKNVPNAPTIGTATDVGTSRAYNNGAAVVTFTAPTFTGGFPITSYTATSSPGGFTATGASSPLTVTGLQSNTAYTFTVTATTSIGTGAASAASNSITATTVPQAPTVGTATCATGQAYTGAANISVPFTAGATGGAAISSFTITSSGGGTASGGSSPIVISCTVGSSYTFTVTATNANGTSAASSASNSVLSVSVPQAPTIGTATAGDVSATVAYTAGATGGAAVSAYTATSSPGSFTGTGASPITVSGLTNGTAYTFTVTATNASGTSVASAASNSITPAVQFPYTLASIGSTVAGRSDQMSRTCVDSSGNYYAPFVSQFAVLMKLNSTSAIQWQTLFNGPSGYSTYSSVGIDSSNNLYAVGVTTFDGVAVKYDSGGTVQWQRLWTAIGGSANFADSSGSSYYGFADDVPSNRVAILAKYDTSGTLQWQRSITHNNFNIAIVPKVVKTDSSGNVYIAGGDDFTSTGGGYLAKFNSAGTFQWIKQIGTSNTSKIVDMVTDSSNNIFLATSQGTSGAVIKLDSSGSIIWQRTITPTSGSWGSNSGGLVLDASGNIYLGGNYNFGLSSAVIKYNSSGAIQWQRNISSGSITSMQIGSSGNLFIGGAINVSPFDLEGWMLTYPTDGSKTGTITFAGGSTTISVSSFTDAAGTAVTTTPSWTIANSSYANSVSSYTSSTPAWTSTVTSY